MHEACPLSVRARTERQRGYHRTGIEQDIRRDGSKPMELVAEVTRIFDEHGNIVVGVRPLVAARPRAIQDNPLKSGSVDIIERRPQAA